MVAKRSFQRKVAVQKSRIFGHVRIFVHKSMLFIFAKNIIDKI